MFLEFITTYIIPFMFVLTVIVFFHELGHYLAARRNGVKVEVFSIGFGTELFGFTDRNTTRWKFCLIPLGGYVKMFSDANAASQPDQEAIEKMSEEDKKQSLAHKSVWARIEVSAAGPIANFVFAIVVLAFLYTTFGQRVPSEVAKIGMVEQGSPAEKAGLKPDDIIVGLNGVEIKNFMDLIDNVSQSKGEVVVKYQRDGATQSAKLTPDDTSGRPLIGVFPGFDKIQHGFVKSWWHAAKDTYYMCAKTLVSVWQMLTGQISADGLSGPIGIAKITGKVSAGGIESLVMFMVFLSINLGLINLFPIPMLDGGHLVFYFIEALIGRPISEKKQEYAFRVGFLILMSLLVFTTFKDLAKFEFIRNLISKLGW